MIAYARRHPGSTLVVVAGRLFSRLMGDSEQLPLGADTWADTAVAVPELANGTRLENVLTGESVDVVDGRIALGAAFARFPGAALLVS